MPFTPELIDEVNILAKYNLETMLEGIKVHKTAEDSVIQATSRLYAKGLITQPDGGYLTDLGREVAEHIQSALTILTSSS